MPTDSSERQKRRITVTKNGPYIVSGGVPLYPMVIECDEHGTPIRWIKKKTIPTAATYALCRCGQSTHKPFCDGTHVKAGFIGTEVSDNEPYEKIAKTIDGPELTLKDAEILCASARFCHRGGDIWDAIPKSDDPKAKENAIQNACDCPSGRLVVVEKKAETIIEPNLDKSVGVVEDPSKGVDGPLWVRGGIHVYSADGKIYEVRNRVTLCRCGKSTNKPFCDSSHYPEEDREINVRK